MKRKWTVLQRFVSQQHLKEKVCQHQEAEAEVLSQREMGETWVKELGCSVTGEVTGLQLSTGNKE